MNIEAMKQWLEALEYPLNTSHEAFNVDMAELLAHRAIESLEKAIAEAEKQEPVPRVVLREGSPTLLSDKAILPTDQRLYTQPDPDALHAAYMSGFYDGKKKREWVGLTKKQFQETVHGLEDLEDCWIAIEAKLKEKNT